MGYIENNLVPGEHLIFKTKLHWWVIFSYILRALYAALLLAIAGYFLLSVGTSRSSQVVIGSINSLVALYLTVGIPFVILTMLIGILNFLSSEFGLTNRRVMIKTGIIRRHTLELNLGKVESFQIRETILGRILGYKTIILTGSGGTKQTFKYVDQAREFQRKVTELSTDRHSDYDDMPARLPRRRQTSVFDELSLPDDNTEQLLRDAAQQIQLGNRQGAQQIVRELMQTAPGNADVWYLVGYLSSGTEKKKQAFERALRIDPNHRKARQGLNAL